MEILLQFNITYGIVLGILGATKIMYGLFVIGLEK
jgi:hypothetical protein